MAERALLRARFARRFVERQTLDPPRRVSAQAHHRLSQHHQWVSCGPDAHPMSPNRVRDVLVHQLLHAAFVGVQGNCSRVVAKRPFRPFTDRNYLERWKRSLMSGMLTDAQHFRVSSAAVGGNAPCTTFLPFVPFTVGPINIHALIGHLRSFIDYLRGRSCKDTAEHFPVGLKATGARGLV